MVDASFLPEDYLAKQAERRTNVISLTLFVVVMTAVFGAFLVTNRHASRIRAQQAAIDSQFQEAAIRIEKLNELESQKERMLEKAELATSLLERVPRSILLAELINRMPQNLTLREFELKSTAIKKPPPRVSETTTSLRDRRTAGSPTREQAIEERAVEAPRYSVDIIMVGIAPTDLEVSQYITELNAYRLLTDVTLKYTIQTTVDDRPVREFRVEMKLDPKGDIREVEPLAMRRDSMRNPMSDAHRFTFPAGEGQ
jgi:Tfp pilus assembly protein PilN